MAGTSQRQTRGRTSAGTGQRGTAQKKASQKKNGKKQTGGSRSGSGRASGSKKNTAAKNSSAAESFVGKEIGILALFAVCVLLFLSNIGLCGAVGMALHGFQRGVFGFLGYVFPVYLFAAALFYLSNRDNKRALAKLGVSVCLLLLLCGVAALLTTKDFDKTITIAQYYGQSASQAGGGVLGGLILKLLCPALGMLGAYIVVVLLLVIGIVFITERSVLEPISRGSRRVYDTAREDMSRRREIHAAKSEERKRYRLEQKVSGVALEPLAGEGGGEIQVSVDEPEPAAAEAEPAESAPPESAAPAQGGDSAKASPVPQEPEPKRSHPIRITGLGFEPEEPADSPIIPVSGDILVPPKDTRTLAELEALDSLHSNLFSTVRHQAVWNEPEETEPEEKSDGWAERAVYLKEIREEEDRAGEPRSVGYEAPDSYVGAPAYETSDSDAGAPVYETSDSDAGAPVYEAPDSDTGEAETAEVPVYGMSEDVPFSRPEVSSEAPADTKRVVTVGGKIVEVDIDPDDDPLTRKRRERRLAKAEAAGTKEEAVRASGAVRPSGFGTGGGPAESSARRKEFQPPEDLSEWASLTAEMPSGPAGSSGRTVSGSPAPEKKQPPKPYVRPPYSLMKSGGKQRKNSDRELRETARKLETTLQNFGVGVTVTNISCGPSVTRYELQPEQGVRVSKIVGLSDDIKLNLAAADIRIEAPIPGKASVGIEVPNKENSTVFLRDVLESEAFKGHPSKLAFAVGRDISGDVVVTDLAKMPHLLIAGATGSGKSVCINTLIMSVLYKAKPEEVRLIMVDPKVVELSIYNGIPHLMIPVVTDPKKAAGALNWAVAEMTDRYRKFADWNVRDLKGYNEKIKAEAEKNGETAQVLPQIVIIVDELADLMMVCPGDVEDAICRLAQMARAAGLHLVIATQRPSVNVITGLIKANVPSRIAFSVSSGVDSRTIIDMNGAEKLLGKGDMLFYPSGYQKPVRVQGAFVSDSEVSAVVDFLKENNEEQTFDSAVEARLASMESGDGKSAGGGQGPERDEYFAEAGRFIIEKQKASIGMLQRMFKVGFNRAARIMDQLAEAGVVSEEAGTKAREILMDMEQYEQLLQELGLA